jgi:uncharacterized protein (DUF433 family)
MYERIVINSKVCHGQAFVKGTRIPVHQVFRMLANGDSVETSGSNSSVALGSPC